MQTGSRSGVSTLEILQDADDQTSQTDSGGSVAGMLLSFLGIEMESLAEGLRTSEEQQGVRTDRLASCLPHQSSPKMPRATDAGSQRGRLQLRGGGQREQITVERRKWKIVRWRGRKGPRSKAAIKTPHKPHTLPVKIKIDTSVMILC